jgi:purine-binding chemotaxis protein CheW
VEKMATPDEKRLAVIDWGEVSRRLEITRRTIERGWTPTAAEKKIILKARAEALARDKGGQAGAKEHLEIVEFLLSHEKYGIESSSVREICPLKEFTPLPGTPPFLLGITGLRGRIFPVIDVRKFFDLPKKGLTDLNKVIVVYNSEMELGILADTILGIRSIPVREIQPSLPTLTGIRAAYLKGVAAERLVILDVEKILADEEVLIREEV